MPVLRLPVLRRGLSLPELRVVVDGARFVVVSRRRGRAAAWFGGDCLRVYSLGGALLDVVGVVGGGAVARRAARRMMGSE